MSNSAKYQIFVSSTYEDLKDERDLVIKAILEMNHIPVGMEMFSAANEEQWDIIKKYIDQSDYYIVVVAHRYGSCSSDGLSYTEKEYDYAVSLGIPALGLILDKSASWPLEKSDNDANAIAKLKAFKDKIKLKLVSPWNNKDDLPGKCVMALMKSFITCPREGWVRASKLQDVAASEEIIRLRAENAKLRERLEKLEQALAVSMIFETERELNLHLGKVLNEDSPSIFADKMRFTNTDKTQTILRRKARRKDLTLYLPRMTEFAKELEDLGAIVCIYGDHRFTPQTRFTIVRSKQHDAQIYFGYKRKDGKYALKIFSNSNGEFAYHVTKDLIDIINTYCIPSNHVVSAVQ